VSDPPRRLPQPYFVVTAADEDRHRARFSVASESEQRDAARVDAISMQRGGCHGTCPVYRVELQRQGRARFTGEAYVKVRSALEGHLSRHRFAELAVLLQELQFFALDHAYMGNIDLPDLEIAVEREGVTTTVVGYGGGGPIELWTIGELIDSTGRLVKWDGADLDRREFPWHTADE
jgi:Domain of unknown function (DUF6438)